MCPKRPVRGAPCAFFAALSLLAAIPVPAQETGEPFPGIDSDHNGISDFSQMLHAGTGNPAADNDRDGINNRDEATAGTDPNDGRRFLNFTTLGNTGTHFQASWPTVAGKRYQLQSASAPAGPWIDDGEATGGDGEMATVSRTAQGGRQFLRLLVTDMDTDGDGVTDWEELQAGTDRYLWDTDGDGFSDRSVAEGLLKSTSTVNIYALEARASESGRTASFRIIRHGGWMPLNILFTAGGTAQTADYLLSPPGSVTLPAGVTAVTVTVTATADAVLEDAETVTLTLRPGSGYSPGAAPSASVTIISQGLPGQYFDSSSGTYSNAANFDPARLKFTRRDAAVNFNWSKPEGTPPGSGTGTPHASITDDDTWTVRWSGFIYPKTNEVYQLHAIADRGIVVWVSPSPITAAPGATTGSRINQWSTTTPETKYSNNMVTGSPVSVAGQPLYFRVDYRDSANNPHNANVQIRWSTPTIAEEPIPGSQFSSEGMFGLPPVINSPLATAGISGAPFSYQITAANSPASFSASGLPAGLTLDSATGLITGTLTGPEACYFATISAANAAGTDAKNLAIQLTTTGGSLTREVWTGLTGAGLPSVPLHTAPSSSAELTTLEAPDNAGEQFGERIRGFLTAPASGLYTFFLTSDENAELWISAGEDPGRRLKRAWVSTGAPAVADGVWNARASQQSVTMRLTAGRRYYLETIRRETTGNDHLAVAWLKPGRTDPAQKEVIPSWALTAYAPPPATGINGTLYAASLTPVPGSRTPGAGTALLQVNQDRTEASLSFAFGNLTGPVSAGQHILDARTVQGETGRVLFDIAAEEPDIYGVRRWVFAPTFTHSVADIVTAIESGNACLSLETAAYPEGEIKGFFTPVSGSQFFVPPAPAPAAELTLPSDPAAAKREIVRFLQQATFGARHDSDGAAPWDADSIESVQQLGYAAWLDAQLALPAGPDPEILNAVQVPPVAVYATATSGRQTPNAAVTHYYGSGPLATFVREYYTRYPRSSSDADIQSQNASEIWRAWWPTVVKSPQQLRHRMAFALSQIIVVSEEGPLNENARAVCHYYDLLYYHGLGNFRTLLERTTLNAGMGRFLDMLGSRKPNPATGYIPNENFAREILQLFSTGLYRLHPDGSRVLDAGGLPLSTYEQEQVLGFSHTFTGWNYADATSNYVSPMLPRPADHDSGEKLLLESAVIPASSAPTEESCHAELATALDVIFHHPNTGPFISRQLIQRLVTANPSPGYIYRVASVFNDNGSGVRGDLAAVAKAILLDPEARNAEPRTLPGFGHLKEPLIRTTQMLRAFKGFSYAEYAHGNTIDAGSVIVAAQGPLNLTQPLPVTQIDPDGAGSLTPRSFTILDGFILGGVDGAATPAIFGTGNAVLVRHQANPAENGIYIFNGNGTLLTRSPRADSGAEVTLAYVKVAAGTDEGKTFRQTATVNNLNTDAQTWAESAPNLRSRIWEMGSTGGNLLAQTPLRSPTVFNFFEPDYVFPGRTGSSGLYGPEFQITSEASVINAGVWFYNLSRHNSANTGANPPAFSRLPFSYGQGYQHEEPIKRDVKLDLTFERGIAADSGVLVDRIAGLLMPGQMTPRLRELLVNYLETLPEDTEARRMTRVGDALYLISLCPEFAVQK